MKKKMQNLMSTKSNKSLSLYYISNYISSSVKAKNKTHKKNKSLESMRIKSNNPKN